MHPPAFHTSLVHLGNWLRAQGYGFTTPTPATHARVNARPDASRALSLRDVFGWSRPFAPGLIAPEALQWLHAAGLLEASGDLMRSRVRFSTLDGLLFAHSAYPTTEADAVFFGPDTYRFAALIKSELPMQGTPPGLRIIDLGCGAGPGGLCAAHWLAMCSNTGTGPQPELVLADISPRALDFAQANAALAGMRAQTTCLRSDLLTSAEGEFDLIVANPPYLVDPAARLYRHGGGPRGTGLAERIVLEGMARLAPGGQLVLYTGVPIVSGVDIFERAVAPLLQQSGFSWRYRELDPDVFGEELDAPAYWDTDRIAAVALVVHRAAP